MVSHLRKKKFDKLLVTFWVLVAVSSGLQLLGAINPQSQAEEKIMKVQKLVESKCSTKYTTNCMLLDVCKVIDNLQNRTSYQLLPGIFLITNKSIGAPFDIFEQVATHNQSQHMDVYVRKKTQAYLDSLSISWKIMDRDSAFSVRQFSDDLISQLLSTNAVLARKKNGKEHGMWAAGALAALGTSALFALTGKAAIASLAALLLSVICYFRYGGHGSSYTAAGTTYLAPYKHQCTEAIIDVNGRGDYTASLMGYKKRTAEDSWSYPPRYASSTETLPLNYRENENMNRLYQVCCIPISN